jgi:hypothetical protein
MRAVQKNSKEPRNDSAIILLAQVIIVSWTKATRGKQGAELRKAIPQEMPLAEDILEVPEGAITQRIICRQSDRFTPHLLDLRIEPHREILRLPGVECTQTSEGIHVEFVYEDESVGMPLRRPWRTNVAMLKVGQWCKVIHNGRFSDFESHWYYCQSTINVGLFRTPVLDGFATRIPVKIYTNQAFLW